MPYRVVVTDHVFANLEIERALPVIAPHVASLRKNGLFGEAEFGDLAESVVAAPSAA